MSSSLESPKTISLLPSLPLDYTLLTTTPTIQNYARLRSAAGLTANSDDAALAGLPNSLHSAQNRHNPTDIIVGMGRIVGDGGLFYQITDMAVDPAHQRKGLGKAILAELMRWLEETKKHGGYVSLLAHAEGVNLYKHFGFTDAAPRLTGMHQILK